MGAALRPRCQNDSDSDSEGSFSSGSDDSAGSQAPDSFHQQESSGGWCCSRGDAASYLTTQGDRFVHVRGIKVAAKPSIDIGAKTLTNNNRGKKLEQYFAVNRKKPLGEGGYASVFTGRELLTGRVYAVKCVAKRFVARPERLQKEIEIMLALDHPNIAKLFQTFEDTRFVYLVLELCTGGELFDRVVEQHTFSERIAALIMRQIFRGVHYMHSVSVGHRDLKPENFLFLSDAAIESNVLKIIDFGIADTLHPGKAFDTKTGTPFYVAPEVLSKRPKYGLECDMWSCGVVMYVLLFGCLPFSGSNDASTMRKVFLAEFSFPKDASPIVSEDAKSLIRRLLTRDPSQRCTAEEALSHRWTTNLTPSAMLASLPRTVVNNIGAFRSTNRMQKAALHLAARHASGSQLEQLMNVFTQLDTDGNGILTAAELGRGLQGAGILPEHVPSIMAGLDTDGSGNIDYTEFLAAAMERRQLVEESACWSAFKVFDRNGDDRISKAELEDVLSSYFITEIWDKNTLSTLMQEVDANGDGFIDFEEFKAMMQR